MKTLYLSESLINDLYNNSSAMELINNNVKKIIPIKGENYVCFGSCSTGISGVKWVHIQKCVAIEFFVGRTYDYKERGRLVDKGYIERGNYFGQKISYKGKEFVFVEEAITAYPVQQAEQLNLF